MPASILFWLFMILGLAGAIWWGMNPTNNRPGLGGWVLLWLAVAIVGWKVLGFIIQ